MKRTAALVLAAVFLLSACIPEFPQLIQTNETPVVDLQATDAAMAETNSAETLNALPTPTLEPATDTPPPAATETESPTATEAVTETATESLTPDPNAIGTETVTATGTLPTATQFMPTATETLYARFFGTQPPAIPYGKVMFINKAKVEVYVSLQCTTVDGNTTILEYPVSGRMNVSAPAGKYTYVAWVGGRQFQGTFGLGKGDEAEMTFMKDKVTIK